MVYKPTYNWGGPHPGWLRTSCSLNVPNFPPAHTNIDVENPQAFRDQIPNP